MAQAHETERRETGSEISLGWRTVQVAVLVVALSYIAGWIIGGPTRFLDKAASGGIVQTYAGLVLFASPLISVLLLTLAVWPHALADLAAKENFWAKVGLALIFLLTAAWLVNAYLYTPMYTKLMTDPLGAAKVLPIPGGVALHMIFQHWFQSAAVIVFAVWPEKFTTLTHSSQPAGVQCAVVDCQ